MTNVTKRAKAKSFNVWLVKCGIRDEQSEFLNSQFLFDDDYDLKNQGGAGMSSQCRFDEDDSMYDKKRALMKMFDIIQCRSKMSKMDGWLSLRVHTNEQVHGQK